MHWGWQRRGTRGQVGGTSGGTGDSGDFGGTGGNMAFPRGFRHPMLTGN